MSDEVRGEAIRRRRYEFGITSVRQFAEATGVDRHAIGRAEAGNGSEATYERLERWLDKFAEETGSDLPEQHGLITIKIAGNFGVTATIQGPVENLAELEDAAARLVREMRAGGDDQ